MLPSKVYISKGYNDFNPKAGSLLASIDSQFADDAEFTCLDGVWHDASEIPDELLMPILILPSKRFAPWMCDVITTAKDWDFSVKFHSIERWAYISDLLPHEKHPMMF